jgi:hypothetical protein
MIDEWNSQRLYVWAITINDFPLVPLQQTYTLGTGGNFNIPRPAGIERYSLIWLANPAQPLELPLEVVNDQKWQETVPVKAIQSTMPTLVYDDQAFPLRNLNFWPIPTIVSNARVYAWNTVTSFPDLVTDETYPPGYLKALRYALAVDLAPEFGREVPQIVAMQAMNAIAEIKRHNLPWLYQRCDDAVVSPQGRQYNWLYDGPVRSAR